jgi:peptidoglycan hydrolase CwlO-like protein
MDLEKLRENLDEAEMEISYLQTYVEELQEEIKDLKSQLRD